MNYTHAAIYDTEWLYQPLTKGSKNGAAKLRKKKRIFIKMAMETHGITLRSVDDCSIRRGPSWGEVDDDGNFFTCEVSNSVERRICAFHLLPLAPLSLSTGTGLRRLLVGVVGTIQAKKRSNSSSVNDVILLAPIMFHNSMVLERDDQVGWWCFDVPSPITPSITSHV